MGNVKRWSATAEKEGGRFRDLGFPSPDGTAWHSDAQLGRQAAFIDDEN